MLSILLLFVHIVYIFFIQVTKWLCHPSMFIRRFFSIRKIRVPHHIAFVFTNKDEISLESLSSLIALSVFHGVKHITIYDPWSLAEDSREELRKRTTDMLEQFQMKTPTTISFENNAELSCDVKVTLLGSQAGRPCLVRVCRKLCTSTASEIQAVSISNALASESIEEPDFLLKIGDVDSLLGYPPWVLRVTELMFIDTLGSSISHRQFLSFLENYRRREQSEGQMTTNSRHNSAYNGEKMLTSGSMRNVSCLRVISTIEHTQSIEPHSISLSSNIDVM
ncbi:hypothetical protein AB6A40_003527 [Gnathostoma spinigerum]|uniref:ditrans,polycis-polyprenyl diphosphate synthase [(2E,6E)-farnesyldiphosphate specific] n=1 Tax=Gnathostoma spinigerum TaxID=75299 RepID=A0ABD6E9Z7_9BILA